MRRCAVVCIALLCCVPIAIVQPGAFAQASNKDNTFSSTLSCGINLRAIAGAPFSADVVKETTKILPDGSTVPVVTRGKMFRDFEGRTRSEIEIVSPASATPRQFVTIVDPVERVTMVLDPQSKTATITPLPEPHATNQAAKPGATISAERISAKLLAIRGAEDLGTSMLEGFSVTGSRRTRPAAATQSGDKAASMILETWFSPELKIELQAKIADPNGAAITTKLQNILAGEPDRMLFEPPADYTVKTISPSK